MITIVCAIVCLPLVIVGTYLHSNSTYDRVENTVITGFFSVIALAILVAIILPFEGLCPNYDNGKISGYVTDLSVKGIIYKTYEGHMHTGSGEQTAVSSRLRFSVKDKDAIENLKKVLGKRIKVLLHYNGWLVLPYRFGSSSYLITNVEILEQPLMLNEMLGLKDE